MDYKTCEVEINIVNQSNDIAMGVDVGFESVIHPYIFTKVNSNVKNDDTFTNKTKIEGNHEGYIVWDKDDHTTKVYEKEITIKKLPRTGM